ncbi:MAG: SCO family protein [Sandaracinaceae bacterium]|nr:MAG: SCO family protein [Sandaracinaceae bacterium]
MTRPAALLSSLALLSGLALSGCGGDEEPIGELMPIGEFSLTDQSGAPFGTSQLRGKVWIADMIFTSCPDICPVMSSQMANLQRRIDHPDVRFVSITVDPETDTPEVLRAYGERYGADHERWRFLTGAPDEVRRVIAFSFRLPVEPREERDDGRYDILHTGQLILVDQRGVLRGLYETDRDGLALLERHARQLAED